MNRTFDLIDELTGRDKGTWVNELTDMRQSTDRLLTDFAMAGAAAEEAFTFVHDLDPPKNYFEWWSVLSLALSRITEDDISEACEEVLAKWNRRTR
jgi:hypothetical protein